MADPIIYRSNPIYGYEPIPNQSSNRLGVPIFINDIGLRDNENCTNLERLNTILVIGNSVTFGGSRTKQEDLFTEILEKKIQIHKPLIKVYNAGVNGYSISQMISRTKSLLNKIDPEYIIMYVIMADFLRAPVILISEKNFVYPTKKPSSALGNFLLLSINYLNRRYNFLDYLPSSIAQWFLHPKNYSPSYNKSNIKEIHINAIENFVNDVWEASGHSRHKIIVLLAPTRQDILINLRENNSDLQTKFDSININFYVLQPDFYTAIITKDKDINDYYWDSVHYREKGHSLAADIIYRYLILNKEFKSN
jgi:lysophospholipase L1-like esterase